MADNISKKAVDIFKKLYPNLAYHVGLSDKMPDASMNEVLSGDPGGMPSQAILPLVERSPQLISKLVAKFGNLAAIPVKRYQKEAELLASHPGRGGRFWSGPGNTTAYDFADHSEGGKVLFNSIVKPTNPLILEQTSSSLIAAAQKLDPVKSFNIIKAFSQRTPPTVNQLSRITGLANNKIREVLSHNTNDKSIILTERLGAELAKKSGYDTVLGLQKYTLPALKNLFEEVVTLGRK